MALFGKKKEGIPPPMAPDMAMPPSQDFQDQDPQSQYPQSPYPQDPQSQYPGQYAEQGYGQYPQQNQQAYPQDQYPQPPQAPAPPPPGSAPPFEMDSNRIGEIAEVIAEEKWKEKEKEIRKVIDWKEEVTTTLAKMQQQITDLKSSFDNLHKGMLGKITEYDENLTNVGTEIKAMEKVFSKVLPSFTDSVNKLQRISGTKR